MNAEFDSRKWHRETEPEYSRSGAAKSSMIARRNSDKLISSSLRCAAAPLREYSGSVLVFLAPFAYLARVSMSDLPG
jgi:hypothetical protein